jgi:hypothetical protein
MVGPVVVALLAMALAATAPRAAAPELRSAALTPSTTPMTIYFGTTHAHTGLNNDHGTDDSTAAEIFAAAKGGSGYSFLLLAEHSGPTGPANPADYYADAQAQAAAVTEDGVFVGLAGYEYSENNNDGDADTGHMTGFGTAEFVNAAAPGMTFNAFETLLVDNAATRPVFAGFNHPVATGHKGAAASLLTPARRQVIALSETSNKVAYNATNEAAYYQAFVKHLDTGWRVSPTCGLDSHSVSQLLQAETASKKPCRTGILAPSLTRENILEAILDRRTYSTRDKNLRTKYSANGSWMGSNIGTPTTVTFSISATDPDTGSSADRITKIQVIGRGGAVVATQTFSAHSVTWAPTVNAGTNPYFFVRVFNGERTAHTAVLAPVWLE